jgi:SAM-dependent methyltransferase
MNEWFKDWFESEDYLSVYNHRDVNDAKKLINLILTNIKLSDSSNVLDLACGSGRHSILFAEKGFDVTGVDISKNLLTIAKKNCELKNLLVRFIEADIRKFYIDLKFSLVVNLFTSFGYFEKDEENFKVFKLAFNSLLIGGYFVFDFINKSYLINNLVPFSTIKVNNMLVEQRRKIENDTVIKEIKILKNDFTKIFTEYVKLYETRMIETQMENCGFKIIHKFGDYLGNEYNTEFSPRLILFAKK